MALESMRRAYAKDAVRELIEAREKAERDEISRIQQAKREGLTEGLSQGLSQGISQGLSQGVNQVARRMLGKGLDLNFIAETTGLSIDEIKQIQLPST